MNLQIFLKNYENNDFSRLFVRKNKTIVKPNILYVEDEFDSIELVRHILTKQFNIDIDIATNRDEAIEKTKNNKYSLIILDINLRSNISGLEALAQIKKFPDYENIPVIALTAFAMKDDKIEFLSKGCTDYISKPFTKDTLIKKTRKCCGIINYMFLFFDILYLERSGIILSDEYQMVPEQTTNASIVHHPKAKNFFIK